MKEQGIIPHLVAELNPIPLPLGEGWGEGAIWLPKPATSQR